MRFKVTLQLTDRKLNTLPINYQYELSAWIYHTIHFADPEFAEWLHEKGYSTGTQRFKFFTFSNIEIPHGRYKVAGDRLRIFSEICSLQISFLIDDAAMPFITGVFQNQDFTLGDAISRVKFRVNTIEKLAEPEYLNQMGFQALSPIVVGKSRMAEGGTGTAYLAPADKDYEKLFFQNLSRKVNVTHPEIPVSEMELATCNLEILNEPRSKIISIKSSTHQATKVKGYLYRLRITAPSEWIKVGYAGGFGEKNSLGMGCVDIFK